MVRILFCVYCLPLADLTRLLAHAYRTLTSCTLAHVTATVRTRTITQVCGGVIRRSRQGGRSPAQVSHGVSAFPAAPRHAAVLQVRWLVDLFVLYRKYCLLNSMYKKFEFTCCGLWGSPPPLFFLHPRQNDGSTRTQIVLCFLFRGCLLHFIYFFPAVIV